MTIIVPFPSCLVSFLHHPYICVLSESVRVFIYYYYISKCQCVHCTLSTIKLTVEYLCDQASYRAVVAPIFLRKKFLNEKSYRLRIGMV